MQIFACVEDCLGFLKQPDYSSGETTKGPPVNSVAKVIPAEDELARLARGEFEFIDLGCGTGESIGFVAKKFGYQNGVGIDISRRKIAGALENGYRVLLADVTKTPLPKKSVSFTSMMDFLEHLPSLVHAEEVIRASAELSRDFLYIRHPSFEDIDYLKQYGVKLCWTDWHGHTNMMLLSEY
ncbi:MAG: class I SAM-dependent methyltransferase, partial [Bdellovibrionales bacterium]|nr:class I SAM-dependent methyltransferase [Bdellovibrionales bacterium]